MKFDPSVCKMFMWKWTAEIYAHLARENGYDAEVIFEGNNWIELGGRWSVNIKDKK